MTPRQIYGWLRMCSLFTVVNKVYAGQEWIKVDHMVIGFSGRIDRIGQPDESKLDKLVAKKIMLQRIIDWCADRKLPIEIEDQSESLIMFKIVIIKQTIKQ